MPNVPLDALFVRLSSAVGSENPDQVTQAILELGQIRGERHRVPDDVLDGLFALLDSEALLKSPVAAQVLAFFEFESSRFTRRQKRRCLAFLNNKADEFLDGDARHAASELCDGNCLR